MALGGERVSPLHIPGWREFQLRHRLEQYLAMDTFIDNDAKALAMGEAWLGSATELKNFMAMVVSTGIGGGIVLDGSLLEGRGGNAGHIGHVIVEPDGQPCACGACGCLEAEASGTAIARITGAPAAQASPEMRRRTGVLVGRGIATAANLLDLDRVLVAGSVALGFGEAFFTAAQNEIDARAQLSHSSATRVEPAGLGSDGPLLGAAAVARRGLGLMVGQVAPPGGIRCPASSGERL